MKIINVIENTVGRSGCAFAHGLSFYAETAKHRMLIDLGPSEESIENAGKLGIDLGGIDTVILSHGHYDHSGGILAFSQINPRADIYMQKTAVMDYYADDGEDAAGGRYRYIGIDKRICDLEQVMLVDGDLVIDDELELFTVKEEKYEIPFTNRRLLLKTGEHFERDDFRHEHYLVIHEGGKNVLISGCAHKGIPNIMDAYTEKYGSAPDVVISGFHLMKKTPYSDRQLGEIKEIAHKLKEYPTGFVTCHCTGIEAYEIMKEIMGDKLEYVHSGEEILI
ncbi:MAG: MBL fold metallo-hydrolase [Lachnospiraceae bacterium]|nr:MBL fold metallo-hydrolase [Lachnospiraceae bacterium]